MPAVLKTTQIQEPSSATINLALDTSGGVTVGQNLKLSGSSSGTTTLVAQSAASGTVTIPAGTGTAAVQGVSTNIVSATSQASTSGTSIPFTGIPSWVKRITVIFSGVSLSSTANLLVQIGDSGGLETTGYVSSGAVVTNSAATVVASNTTGFIIRTQNAGVTVSGHMILTNVTGNLWVSSHSGKSDTTTTVFGGGDKTLSDTLTQLSITSTSTDTFDAGTINIMYE